MKTHFDGKNIRNYFSEHYVLIILFSLILVVCVFSWIKIQIILGNTIDSLGNIDIENDFPLSSQNGGANIENTNLYLAFHEFRSFFFTFLVTLIGTIVSSWALYVQYIFNKRQKNDLSAERFTNQYFHILDVYRDICSNTTVLRAGEGKTAFHYMFYEYKAIWNIIKEDRLLPEDLTDDARNRIVFKIFLDGVSIDFLPRIDASELPPKILEAINKKLLNLQAQSEQCEDPSKDRGVKYIRDYRGRRIKYFDGHRLRLIPYFKYIFLIFDHIESNNLDKDKKEQYLRYLYSEMSEHEIGLLFSYLNYSGNDKRYFDYINILKRQLDLRNSDAFIFNSGRFTS